MSKMNLTEATMLALQGKLEENKTTLKKRVAETKVTKRLKTENIDVNVDDKTNVSVMGNETVVDTPDATIIVDKKNETCVDCVDNTELPVEVSTDSVEVPVTGDETLVPEVDAPIETPDVDLPIDTEVEPVEDEDEDEEKEESKKVENVEIEVSDDGKEIEVKTDDGEEVEVKDETPSEEEIPEESESEDGEEEIPEEFNKLENSRRVFTERQKCAKRKHVKAECRRAVKENKILSKKEEEKDRIIKERVEKIKAKRTESMNSFKYNVKSFNESLTSFYKRNTKTIESAEITKLNVVGKNLVIEAKLSNKDGLSRTTKFEMRPISSTNAFTRYSVTEISNIKTESKTNSLCATMLTLKNKNNVTECKYINKK